MNNIFFILIAIFFFTSCDKKYENIDYQYYNTLTIFDTLLKNDKVLVLNVGKSLVDKSPKLLVKDIKKAKRYLFEYDCKLLNDSTIIAYEGAFVYDEDGGFKSNGIWVYTKFDSTGIFPFKTDHINFSVDSIPKNYTKKLPIIEGIYFYKNNDLTILSTEQSEAKFKEKKLNGFYYLPNTGRLFDKINILDL